MQHPPIPGAPSDGFLDPALLLGVARDAPFGVALLSVGDWRYLYVNAAYRRLTGTLGRTLIGQAMACVFDGVGSGFRGLLAATAAAGQPSSHRALQAQPIQGGPELWCDFDLIPLPGPNGDKDGAIASVLVIQRDVTADVQARAAEAAASATLDALLRHIPEGITIADAPDVVTRRISAYGLAMVGRTAEEVLGLDATRSPAVWDVYHPDGRKYDATEMPLRRAVTGGEVVIDETLLLRRPDGRELALLCNAGPIRREDGSISGGVIAWRDVTEQRQAAVALREALALREVLLDELNHRVMNSLQLVIGLLKMQERRMAEPLAAAALAEAGSRVHVIAGAYRHLRHGEGVALVSLAALLHDICAQIDGIRPGVSVTCAAINPALRLNADRAAPLGLVVNELLTNACKHAFPPGRDGRVTVSLTAAADGAMALEVSDDGVGTEREAARAGGLGRSLVRSLTAQLGATLDIGPGAQGGIRVRISLPPAG